MRVEQRSQLATMQQLESRSDEELESETKYKAAAQAILGARAAERYDAPRPRSHFQRAIAAARPQERMQLRRMADASLALAERRAGDLKTATETAWRRGADQQAAARAADAWACSLRPRARARSRGSAASCWSILLIVAVLAARLRDRQPDRAPVRRHVTRSADLLRAGARVRRDRRADHRRTPTTEAGAGQARRADGRAGALTRPAPCAVVTRSRAVDPESIRARFPVGESIEIRSASTSLPGDDVLA